MAKHTLIDTDESTDGQTIFFYSKSGATFEADRDSILQYIVDEHLNQETSGYGLTSDPYSRDEVISVDEEEYYSDHTDEVNESYFKHVINKH